MARIDQNNEIGKIIKFYAFGKNDNMGPNFCTKFDPLKDFFK